MANTFSLTGQLTRAAVALALMLSSVCLQAQGLTAPPVQTRVRITAGSDVELPGVFRMQGKTMSGPIVSSDPDAVTVRDANGRMIMLPRPGHRIVGGIVGVDEQTVRVAREGGSVVTVPRSAIALLERSDGHRSRRRGAGLGLLVGGGGGAGVGFFYGRSRKCTGFFASPGAVADQPCFLEPQASTLAGLILGGGGGALIGALVTRERWVVVPPDWLTGR